MSIQIEVSHDDDCLLTTEKDYAGQNKIAVVHALSEQTLIDVAETGFPALLELAIQAHAAMFYEKCSSQDSGEFNVPMATFSTKGNKSAVNAHRKLYKYLSEQRRIAPQPY